MPYCNVHLALKNIKIWNPFLGVAIRHTKLNFAKKNR
jgi:hypothetical protein